MQNATHITPEDAFEICVQALQTGATLEACLQLYPQWQDAFRLALQAVQLAQMLPVLPSGEAFERSRTVLLGRAAALRQQQLPRRGWHWYLPRLAVALLLVIAVVFSGGGLVTVSAQSLPGDQMYPIKRAVEQVRLQIAPSLEQKTAIEDVYQQRRVAEILQLFELQRVEQVHFQGVLQTQDRDYWCVGGVLVAVGESTLQIGEIELGVVVEVEGSTQPGGWVTANEVHLKARELLGVAQQIEQSFWVVDGTRLVITPLSQLDARVQVGDWVLVMLQAEHDGSLSARAILRYPQPVVTPMVVTVTPEPARTLPAAVPTSTFTSVPVVPQSTPRRVVVEFEGRVMYIAGNLWTIGTQQVVVSPETRWKGAPQVGDWVEVEAWFAPNGSLFALEIETKGGREQQPHEDDAHFEEHESLQAPAQLHYGDDGHSGDGLQNGEQKSPQRGDSSNDD